MEIGRDLIRGYGKEIDIEITGVRRDEKLKEQRANAYEAVEGTPLPGVFSVTPQSADAYVTAAHVAHLEATARTMDNPVVRPRVFAHLEERLRRTEPAAG